MVYIMNHLDSVSCPTFNDYCTIFAGGCLGYLGSYIFYPMMTSMAINPVVGATYMALNTTMFKGCKALLPEKIYKIASVCSLGFAALATFKITGVVLSLKSIVLIILSTVLVVAVPIFLTVTAIGSFFSIAFFCTLIYGKCTPTPLFDIPVRREASGVVSADDFGIPVDASERSSPQRP